MAAQIMRVYWAILGKDLRSELRTRQTLVSTFVFGVLVLVVFNFSFELRGADLLALAPGVLWATFIFDGLLALGRTFAAEGDNGAIEALILAPVDRGLIFLAKWTLTLLLMLLAQIVLLAIFAAVFNVNAFSPLILLDLLLGSAGFAAVGTALSVVAFNTRAREILLPILLLPLSIPLIIAAVRTTSLALTGAPLSESVPWLNLMAGFDILFGVVCYYLFGSLIEE
ncbi:MAG: heme exporter protein CcmB [Dehalococcoidia bacterium]